MWYYVDISAGSTLVYSLHVLYARALYRSRTGLIKEYMPNEGKNYSILFLLVTSYDKCIYNDVRKSINIINRQVFCVNWMRGLIKSGHNSGKLLYMEPSAIMICRDLYSCFLQTLFYTDPVQIYSLYLCSQTIKNNRF